MKVGTPKLKLLPRYSTTQTTDGAMKSGNPTPLLWLKSNNFSTNFSADISTHAYMLLNNCTYTNFTIKRFYTMLSNNLWRRQ